MTGNPHGYYVQPATIGTRGTGAPYTRDTPAVILDSTGTRLWSGGSFYPASDATTPDAANAEAEAALAALLQTEAGKSAAYLEPGDLVEFGGRVEIVREVRRIRGGGDFTVFYDMPPVEQRTPPPSAKTEAARRKWHREQPPQASRCNTAGYLDRMGFERIRAREEQAA